MWFEKKAWSSWNNKPDFGAPFCNLDAGQTMSNSPQTFDGSLVPSRGEECGEPYPQSMACANWSWAPVSPYPFNNEKKKQLDVRSKTFGIQVTAQSLPYYGYVRLTNPLFWFDLPPCQPLIIVPTCSKVFAVGDVTILQYNAYIDNISVL